MVAVARGGGTLGLWWRRLQSSGGVIVKEGGRGGSWGRDNLLMVREMLLPTPVGKR